jgi:glycosyltransferase involved in cell wall biosynthesis
MTGNDDTAASDVTVIIPIWDDYVTFLPEAVTSVAEQLGIRSEVIVVDNQSRVAVPHPPGVRVLRAHKRTTVGAVRNLAIPLVTTKYVMFWDADDRLLPGTLAVLHTLLDSDPDAVAAACTMHGWDANSDRRVAWTFPGRWAFRLADHRALFAVAGMLVILFPTTGATLMRTRAVQETQGFADADYCEDWLLAATLALRGRILLTRHVGRLYRVHDTSLTARAGGDPWCYETVARKVRHALRHDPAAPLWLPALAPLIAVYHRRQLRRTRAGSGLPPTQLPAE